MTEIVRVDLGERAYDIVVGERLLARAGEYIAPRIKTPSVVIISDESVARLYLHRFTGALEEQHIRTRCVLMKSGDGNKNLSAFSALIESVLEQKPERKTTLIALGGGVVGDMTGFAASVLLRGVDFIQIPTTLLAQVDSSVGGKTGINSALGKNLIGSFHQPVLVLADVSTLSTLPKRELLAGYAEMLKYGLINDPAFFDWLDTNATALLGGDNALMTHAIVHSCNAKAAIVAADEKEHNVRALLNFGHTFGHALEAEANYSDRLIHGEAVAIGMMMAFATSVQMGVCSQSDLSRLQTHYQKIGLLSSLAEAGGDWDISNLIKHFSRDKKNSDGKLTFILTKGIGKAYVTQEVDMDLVRDVLAKSANV
jgi:3-dehydroquinate synthase